VVQERCINGSGTFDPFLHRQRTNTAPFRHETPTVHTLCTITPAVPTPPLHRFFTWALLYRFCTFSSMQPSPLVHSSLPAPLLHHLSAPFSHRICTAALIITFVPLLNLLVRCNPHHSCTAPFPHRCCTTRLYLSLTASAPLRSSTLSYHSCTFHLFATCTLCSKLPSHAAAAPFNLATQH